MRASSCTISRQTGVMMATYPCRNDEIMNIAIFHSTKPRQADDGSWNAHATVADAIETLKEGFHPVWTAMLNHADEVKCYTVSHRDVIPRMNNGRAVVVGDAAHPMAPTVSLQKHPLLARHADCVVLQHAQGGCSAIEDTAALEALFTGFDANVDSVADRLKLSNQLRLPRANVTQLLSNAMFYRVDSSEQMNARMRKYYQGPLIPDGEVAFSKGIQEFFSNYDVYKEASKAMEYKSVPGGVPDGVIKHFW